MRKTSLSLLFPLLVVKAALGQSTDSHLKLSNEYPVAGEKITLTYDSVGTVLDVKKPAMNAVVFYLDNKDYPADDIEFTPQGGKLVGTITMPANAKAFFIRMSKDAIIDNNNDKGYVYMVYKDKKPVQGACAMTAYMLTSGMGTALAKIKMDKTEGMNLYQEEFKSYPQSRKDYGYNYSVQLVTSTDPSLKPQIDNEMALLTNSGEEKNMKLAAAIYTRQKKTATADSLNAVIKVKFPESNLKNQMLLDFSKEKDPTAKEILLNAYLAKYPAEPTATLDNLRTTLAQTFLTAGKIEDYNRLANKIVDKKMLSLLLNSYVDRNGKANQNLEIAATVGKQAIDITEEMMAHPKPVPYKSPKMVAKDLRTQHSNLYDSYAGVLLAQNKPEEALKYEELPYKRSPGRIPEINENFALILNGVGQYDKAMEVVEVAIRNGKSTAKIDSLCKVLYVRKKGSEKNYGDYLALLRGPAIQAMKSALAKEMIKQPAPLFALKDLDGKMISLADLKGKTVIVDFWATWCGPCKASFPGMQLAVNQFKDNPNVVFVFVDTRETDENYINGVKKFITDNKYTFHVLLDDEMNDKKQRGKIIDAFHVTGIPTKFIIDGNGDIRFTKVGFSGSAEALADEVSAMVNLAQHPEAAHIAETAK